MGLMLNENLNYYDILEITPDASTEEIKEAYRRIKSTFQKDHVALYTLFSPSEREDIITKTEEAYLILSDSDKRRAYDQNHGLLVWEENPFKGKDPASSNDENEIQEASSQLAEVISIDRSPPMELSNPGEDALASPTTDYIHPETSTLGSDFKSRGKWTSPNLAQPTSYDAPTAQIVPFEQKKQGPIKTSYPVPLVLKIQTEKEWPGDFLKNLRESLEISIEEMSEETKVSKNYIKAIEEENFKKLPAPVYVRGFVLQIARVLKLPANDVATAYLSRYCGKLIG